MKLFDKIKGLFGKENTEDDSKKAFKLGGKGDIRNGLGGAELYKSNMENEKEISNGNIVNGMIFATGGEGNDKAREVGANHITHHVNQPKNTPIIKDVMNKHKDNVKKQDEIRAIYKEIDRLVRLRNKTKSKRTKSKLLKRIVKLDAELIKKEM